MNQIESIVADFGSASARYFMRFGEREPAARKSRVLLTLFRVVESCVSKVFITSLAAVHSRYKTRRY